ncbi:hypothetical protein FLL45_12970 [Aliikangiella marina]|uniref:Uncharacterized protein n=1 Tax=Aliikangiella marina TaxID=1712262 RepID=A0A545T9A0_9GAMM|nr:hypothetical protein [Aliikangiella marina]TQV73775.1 hypothetical protein FLL45_12970 [Aliikangiella marina]
MKKTSDNELAELVEQYKKVEAPTYLASKIMANIESEPSRRSYGMPVFSAMFSLAILALFVLITPNDQVDSQDSKYSAIPSMSEASKVIANKPKMVMPSLTSLGGVATHVSMPSRKVLDSQMTRSPTNKSPEAKDIRKSERPNDETIKRLI